MTEKIFDSIILGAGPAGLSAGRALVNKGCTTILLLDKTVPWNNTVPCAEGVGKLGFHESASPVAPSWIRHTVIAATFHSPDGHAIEYIDKHGGYIIDRARMQADIAQEIADAGVDCRFNVKAVSVSESSGGIRTVRVADGRLFSGRVVIDASGPMTRFGTTEPIISRHSDLEPAYFVWVEGITIPTDRVHIYTGQNVAPGGYAWIFPRGTDGANIGIVLGRGLPQKVNIRFLLDRFLEKEFPSARIVKRFAGPIPCGFKRQFPIALPGFIKAGDAASTVNPISRAGISEAMLSGRLAGGAAFEMLASSSKKELVACAKRYERLWNEKRGNRHLKLAKVKNSFRSIPDEDYNRGAKALSEIPKEEMTMSKIFRASLSRFPRLVWALRHLM